MSLHLPGLYILDDNKRPVSCPDVLTWGRWIARDENRLVAHSFAHGLSVSTVFLGIDGLTFICGGPPLIWETMVFGGPPNVDQSQRRYATYRAALRGHIETCRKLGVEVRSSCPRNP